MSIKQLYNSFAGQVGVLPNRVTMLTTDHYSTITQPGWYNTQNQINKLTNVDIVEVIFNYDESANTGNYTVLQPTIAQDGTVTLDKILATTNAGPFTSGHIATFQDSTGIVIDSGVPITSIPTKSGSFTIGSIPEFNSTSGNIVDSTIAASNLQLKSQVAARTVAYAGGSASFIVNLSTSLVTSSSIIVANFVSQANPASILTAVPGTNTLSIVATADPGASVIAYIVYLVSQ